MSYPDSDESQDKEFNEEEFNSQKEQILKQLLSPDARARLNNIKMVKKEQAEMLENYLITMATQGRFKNQITDDQLKQILLSIQRPKRDFKINRI